MRAVFVVNPAARHGRAARLVATLADRAEALGLGRDVRVSERPGHAEAIAREAAPACEVVVAVGGDGTVHEVASGLLASGVGTALGVVPVGTGNDFAKLTGFGVGADVLARLPSARWRRFDVARVSWAEAATGARRDAVFVNSIGVGFDGLVASFAPRFKRLGGTFAYVAAVFAALRRYDAPHATLSLDGQMVHEGRLHLCAVGNGPSAGGGFRLAPHAVPDDGWLDVTGLEAVGIGRLLRLLPKAIRGTHLGQPSVFDGRARRVDLALSHGVCLHLDGEVLSCDAARVVVEIDPARLPVLVAPS